jgi:AcrR family transcriptional regulator
MARIKSEKEFKIKKDKIIDDAIKLLIELGYEEFSINKFIKKFNLTKGAFFHYFKNKNELIEEIVGKILNPMVEKFEEISIDKNLKSKEKINMLFYIGYKMKGLESDLTNQLIRLLHKDENKFIFQEIREKTIDRCLPIYQKVFHEGNITKEFNILEPHGDAFIFLNTVISINKEIGILMVKEKVRKYEYENLKSKIFAFELYTKKMFNLENDSNFYKEEMFQYIKKKIV